MKKAKIIILLLISLLTSFIFSSGYSFADTTQVNLKAIQNLLPSSVDFKWYYNGFVDYTHYTTLKSISKSLDSVVYNTEGKFISMKGSEGDTPIKVIYTATSGVLIQEKLVGKNMFDKYSKMELIRTPLNQGNVWYQSVKNDQGKFEKLECTIIATGSKFGKKFYRVKYKDISSNYYEMRDITENVGVTSYARLLNSNEEPVGYQAVVSSTGPLSKQQMLEYMPPLNTNLHYCGYAEYGHDGVVKTISERYYDGIYEFQGVYNDGAGKPDKFNVRYYMDYDRGTATEKVISNDRTNKAEINSKIHNLVILRTPFNSGATWSHKAKVNGIEYLVKSTVKSVTNDTIKVRYDIVGNVSGYYNEKYFEERTFKKGKGMVSFNNILPLTSLGDVKPTTWEEALNLLGFGYSLNN